MPIGIDTGGGGFSGSSAATAKGETATGDKTFGGTGGLNINYQKPMSVEKMALIGGGILLGIVLLKKL